MKPSDKADLILVLVMVGVFCVSFAGFALWLERQGWFLSQFLLQTNHELSELRRIGQIFGTQVF